MTPAGTGSPPSRPDERAGDAVSHDVAFRVTKGLRLRTARRGPRVAIGPRIARIHVGEGPAETFADRGTFARWSTLAGGGHTVPDGAANRPRIDAWQDQRSHLDALLTAHHASVARARAPEVPRPEPIAISDVRRELRRRATAGIPRRRIGTWLRAVRRADRHLDAEVARRQQEQDAAHEAQQAEADAWWSALLANDEPVVLEQLERAFREHALPATPTAVEGATVHLVTTVDTPDRLIGKREPVVADEGPPSLPIMSKPRRHDLYVQAISSAVLAIAAETFAVAPSIETIVLAVLEPGHPSGPAVIALCELERAAVLPDGAERSVMDDLTLASEEGRARLVLERSGPARSPRPLTPDDPSVDLILSILEVEG